MTAHLGHGADMTRNITYKHREPRWPLHNWGWNSAGDAARGFICDKRSTYSKKMLVPSHETVSSQCLTLKICPVSITVGTEALGSNDSMKASSYIWLVNRIAVFCYVSSDLHLKKYWLNNQEYWSNLNKTFKEVETWLHAGASGSAPSSADCGFSAFQPHVEMGLLWPASQLAISARSSFFPIFSQPYMYILYHNRTVGIHFFHSIPHHIQYALNITNHFIVMYSIPLLLYVINPSQGPSCCFYV